MLIKNIARYMAIGSLFLVPIFVLVVAESLFFPFITGKAIFFRILVEIAFASWVILAFFDPKYRPRWNPLTVAVSVFALVTLLADLLGVNPLRSVWSNFERMEGWITVIHLWAFYMAATGVFGHEAEGKRWWYRWLNMSLAVAVVVGIYGLFQIFGWAAVHQGSTRIDASLGNAAYMAVYMLFHAFIAAYLFFARADTVKSIDFPQWLYAILAVVFSFLVFQTATRGSILGLIGGVLLALFLYAVCGKKELRKSRSIATGAIVAIVLIGIVFWLNRSASFIQNSEVLSRLASISLQENKTQARGYIWPMAIRGWQERPILGWGQENFNYIFNSNYEPAMWSHEQWFDRAHSVFLDWLTAAGAVGFLSYLSLYVLCLMAIWKSDLSLRAKSTLTGLVAGYAIHNVFVFDNLASYVFFFGILGFAGSLKQGKPIKWMGTESVRTDAVEYIVAPIVLVALVASIYVTNVRPLQASRGLIGALQACANGAATVESFENVLARNAHTATQETREQLISCTGNVVAGQYPPATKKAFFELAGREIQAHTKANPNDARMYVLAGTFLNSIGQYAEAETMLTDADRLSPHKQSIIFNLASAKVNLGKTEEALALTKAAYESAPENPQSRLAYASMLVLAGKEAEARTLFGTDPEIFESDMILQAYVSRKEYNKAIALYEKRIAANPSDMQPRVQLAQVFQLAGQISKAIEVLRGIAKDFPQYKASVDEAIKSLQAK